MDIMVGLQTRELSKGFATLVTDMGFVTRVQMLVASEISFTLELLEASRASPLSGHGSESRN